MEAYREEALRVKQIAERRFVEKDFTGARSYALKARSLFPDLEGLSQMIATFEVYLASQCRSGGQIDYYAVLGLKPSAGKREVKKQYKKMAVLLHPDKNKCIGADGAFHLISEAWGFLSNEFNKSTFYYKRK
ncbi:PREDICTED: dnaJ homolog subfamily B member 14-like, partial [Camelina sativa]